VRPVSVPGPTDLAHARAVVAEHLAPTPVIAHDGVRLKLETLQPTGSFKVRGALAALSAFEPGEQALAASAGNHALGVAYAGAALGVPVRLVVPETASPAKVAALARLGADLVRAGAGYDEAEAHALAEAARDGRRFVSPYNDRDVIAGAATVGAELVEALGAPLTVVCPIGGGGLASGVALCDGVRVIGVEAAASAALAAALAGRTHDERPTIADGLAGGHEPGSVTIELLRDRLDALVSVTEEEIRAAIAELALRAGLVSEGAGAAALAAVRAGRVPVDDRTVVLVTGHNIAPALLVDVLKP
jgi:threonine dehydratase